MSRMYGELIAAAAESVGSDPATTNVGRLTYRTDTKVFRGYADAAWRTIATLDQVQAFSNKSFSDAPTFSTMTIGSILFAGTAGVLTQDNTNLTWTAASKTLTVGGGTSEFFGADAAESFIRISGYRTSASNIVGLYLRAYRGTKASPTVLVNADSAAAVRFQGQSTSTVVESALISFVVDAAPGAGTVPTAIVFTTGTGAANAEAMRITSGGFVGIGTVANSNLGDYTKLRVAGSGSGSAGSIGSRYGTGTGAIDTLISINQTAGGGTLLLLASRHTDAGTATESAVYIVQMYYDGDNAPTYTYVGGSSNFVTFGVSGTKTITITNSGGGAVNYAWFGNK